MKYYNIYFQSFPNQEMNLDKNDQIKTFLGIFSLEKILIKKFFMPKYQVFLI